MSKKKSASWSAACVKVRSHTKNRTKRHFHVPRGYEAQIVEIGHLPLYNFDYDDPAVTDFPTPSSYTEFRRNHQSFSRRIVRDFRKQNRTVRPA